MAKSKTIKGNRSGGGVAAPAPPPRGQAHGNAKNTGRRARARTSARGGFVRTHPDGVCMAALAVLAFAVFAHCLPYAFIDFDTADFIRANPHVRNGLNFSAICWAFTNFLSGYWTPLPWLSHMLDCSLYGSDPWGHHLSSLLIHAANASLLFLALRRMSGAFWRSAFVAAIFAIHPLRVESVVWIAERKDVISAFFLIVTLLAYERYCRGEFSLNKDIWAESLKKYLWVFAGMLLGLASKPSVVTIPCLLLLLDFWPLRRWPARAGEPEPGQARPASLPALLLEKAPLLALTVIFSALTYYAQDSQDITMKLPLGVRLSNAALNYAAYLGKTFWPFSLALIYPVSKTVAPLALLAPAVLALAGLSLAAALAWRRRPYLTAGWCWFLGLLVPMIGIVQVGGQSIADRYSYLAQSGLVIVLAWGAAEVAGRLRLSRRTVAAAAGAVILLLVARTAHQVTYWRDDIPLWEHTLKVTRNNATANLNYGYLLGQQGKLDEAIIHLEAALAADPKDQDALTNLGIAHASKGDYQQAEECFQRALKIRPDHYLVHFNLGLLARLKHDTARAIAEFQAAARIGSDNPNPMLELATIWMEQGAVTSATESLKDARRRAAASGDIKMVKQIEEQLRSMVRHP